jgi:hypothetical protein
MGGKTMTAQEILEMQFGNSKNLMTPRILGRGMIGDYTAYELSRSRGVGLGDHVFYGLTFVSYLPEFSIPVKLNALNKSGYDCRSMKNYVRRLKRNPGIVEQEIGKLDAWVCDHGVNRWHHPECWLYYMTGQEKYRVMVEKINKDLENNHEWGAGI